jgi:kynurenine 3-monooxygenase
MPLHAMVTNTTMPYAAARQRAVRQHRILQAVAAGIGVVAVGGALRRLLR